jgi:hypothetical protein
MRDMSADVRELISRLTTRPEIRQRLLVAKWPFATRLLYLPSQALAIHDQSVYLNWLPNRMQANSYYYRNSIDTTDEMACNFWTYQFA